jgi:hypothetical protein
VIKIRCACGQAGTVTNDLAGKRIRCQACRAIVKVPSFEELARRTSQRPALILERNVVHEAHVRAIAFWHRAGGALAIVALVYLLHFLGRMNRRLDGLSTALVFFMIALGVASFAIGHALSRYVNQARWWTIGAALAGMIVPFFRALAEGRPGAAVLSVAVLAWFVAVAWALNNPQAETICSPAYRRMVSQDKMKIPWWLSPFAWGPGAGLIFLLAVSIAALKLTVRR